MVLDIKGPLMGYELTADQNIGLMDLHNQYSKAEIYVYSQFNGQRIFCEINEGKLPNGNTKVTYYDWIDTKWLYQGSYEV